MVHFQDSVRFNAFGGQIGHEIHTTYTMPTIWLNNKHLLFLI